MKMIFIYSSINKIDLFLEEDAHLKDITKLPQVSNCLIKNLFWVERN